MDLYAPEYYTSFVCIADKCRHSCCVGWEIDVDGEALKKYESAKESYAQKVIDSIEGGDTPHFALGKDERCPHLRADGLCRIILEMGVGYLCNICREHPRFYNYASTRKEVGLGLVCEEACRIILTSDDYATMLKIGEAIEIAESYADTDSNFDALTEREKIYALLSDASLPYVQRLDAIGREYSVSPSNIPDKRWRELLSCLEYLNDEDRKLFSLYSSNKETPPELEKYLQRALAYFIFRHVTPAFDLNDLSSSLGLSLFLERLLCSAIVAGKDFGESAIFDVARRLSEELEYSEENTEAIKFEFEI